MSPGGRGSKGGGHCGAGAVAATVAVRPIAEVAWGLDGAGTRAAWVLRCECMCPWHSRGVASAGASDQRMGSRGPKPCC